MEVDHLVPGPLGAAEAIAMSDALLRSGDNRVPTVIWWEVVETALIVGRTAAPSIVDEGACDRIGVPVVRRHTGGGPLLWDDGLLAVDVILPKADPRAPIDVVEAYRWLGDAAAAALRDVGVPAQRLEPAAARANTSDADDAIAKLCFGGLSPHEIVVGDRKIAGLCQARRSRGSLLQLGVLVDVDCTGLAGLVHRGGLTVAEFARDLDDRVTTVGDHAFGVSATDVRSALKRRIHGALQTEAVAKGSEGSVRQGP